MKRLFASGDVLHQWRWTDTRIHEGSPSSPTEEREEAEIQVAIRGPTMRWLTLAGMVWRTASVLVAISGAWSWLKAESQLLSVAIIVIVANAVVIVVLTRRPAVIRLLDTPTFLAVDVGVAFGLNLLASWVIETGTLYGLGQYRDLFSPYLWGTVIIWTGIRGAAMGALFVVLAAVPLQVGMAR